jgi:hypothetical protein
MEHVRYGRSVSRKPPSVDFDAVPLVRPLVAAFGLVHALIPIKVGALLEAFFYSVSVYFITALLSIH